MVYLGSVQDQSNNFGSRELDVRNKAGEYTGSRKSVASLVQCFRAAGDGVERVRSPRVERKQVERTLAAVRYRLLRVSRAVLDTSTVRVGVM